MKTLRDFTKQELKNYGIFDTIVESYNWVKSNPADQRGKDSIQWIAHYMETLYKYSKRCTHITEMGINQVNSTWAFLLANPEKLTSIDIDLHQRPSKKTNNPGVNLWLLSAQELAKQAKIDFNAIEGDTTKILIEETDLLFIDTEHSYACLSAELKLHSNKVRKYIVLHDTLLFKKELEPAIEEFLEKNKNWDIELVLNSNPGLTVLKRIQ